MNTTLIALTSGELIHGDDAKAMVGQLLGNMPELAELHRALHHRTADGKTIGTASPVKFLGRRTGFALLGFGETGQDLIEAAAPHIIRAWAARDGLAIRAQRSQHNTSWAYKPWPITYQAPNLVIQKRERDRPKIDNCLTGHVEALIARHLAAHAAILGLPSMPGLQVQLLEHAGMSGHLLKTGAKLAVLKRPVITINAKLTGYWPMGYLTAHGKGVMHADAAMAAMLGGLQS